MTFNNVYYCAFYRMESRTEFKIKSPPTDAISAVEFGPNSTQFLLVSSWDSTVRLYDIHANTMRLKYNHDLPVLDVAFQVSKSYFFLDSFFLKFFYNKIFLQDAVHAYSGGLGNTLKMYDINSNTGITYIYFFFFNFIDTLIYKISILQLQ